MILTKCSVVLVRFEVGITESKKGKKSKIIKEKRVKLNKKKIWECLLEDTTKNVIYIRLPSKMVAENKLTTDMKTKAEVQFKLSRVSIAGWDWNYI